MNRFSNKLFKAICAVAAVGAAFGAGKVHAQQQTAQAGLEEIVVTAQRRSENLQSVPIAITALTSNEIERRQITRTIDLLGYIPNLEGHNNTGLGSANTYFLRGIGSTESLAVFDPPVGTYVDEFYNARQNQNNFSFFDVDRIEVVRGPQGTLYGRNTTGGSINVYMKKPAQKFGGYAELGYGKYGETMARASVDLPLVGDKFLTKWSAFYLHDDGYVYNMTTHEHLNYQHSYGLRGATELRFSDSARWNFSTDYVDENYTNLVNIPGPNGGRVDYTPRTKSRGLGSSLISAGLAKIPLGNDSRQVQAISNFGIQLNDSTNFNAITGYHHYRQGFMTDSADGLNTAAPNVVSGTVQKIVPGNSTPLVNDGVSDEFTQELKLAGKIGQDFVDYVAGFYYFFEKSQTDFASNTITPSGVASSVQDRNLNNRTDAYAGYAQADFHVTQQLKLTAGIRYTAEYKNIEFLPNATPITRLNPPFSTNDIINQGVPNTLKAKLWTPRFALNYQINEAALVYASATKGFKSGGWNGRSNLAQQTIAFGPEVDWTYEAGAKVDWLNKRLRTNLNFFYNHDAQFQGAAAVIDRVTNVPTYLTQNFATFRDYGIEGEITAVPVDNLNLYWSFGTQHGDYANLTPSIASQLTQCAATQATTKTGCGAAVVTPTGTLAKPVRVPNFMSTVGFNYVTQLAGAYELVPSVAWKYTSSNWVSSANLPGTLQAAHSLINAGLALRNTDQHWSLMIECTNCFNKTYVESFITLQFLSEPGRWLLHAKYNF